MRHFLNLAFTQFSHFSAEQQSIIYQLTESRHKVCKLCSGGGHSLKECPTYERVKSSCTTKVQRQAFSFIMKSLDATYTTSGDEVILYSQGKRTWSGHFNAGMWNDSLRFLTDDEIKKLGYWLVDKRTDQYYYGVHGTEKRFVIGEKIANAAVSSQNPFGISRAINHHGLHGDLAGQNCGFRGQRVARPPRARPGVHDLGMLPDDGEDYQTNHDSDADSDHDNFLFPVQARNQNQNVNHQQIQQPLQFQHPLAPPPNMPQHPAPQQQAPETTLVHPGPRQSQRIQENQRRLTQQSRQSTISNQGADELTFGGLISKRKFKDQGKQDSKKARGLQPPQQKFKHGVEEESKYVNPNLSMVQQPGQLTHDEGGSSAFIFSGQRLDSSSTPHTNAIPQSDQIQIRGPGGDQTVLNQGGGGDQTVLTQGDGVQMNNQDGDGMNNQDGEDEDGDGMRENEGGSPDSQQLDDSDVSMNTKMNKLQIKKD